MKRSLILFILIITTAFSANVSAETLFDVTHIGASSFEFLRTSDKDVIKVMGKPDQIIENTMDSFDAGLLQSIDTLELGSSAECRNFIYVYSVRYQKQPMDIQYHFSHVLSRKDSTLVTIRIIIYPSTVEPSTMYGTVVKDVSNSFKLTEYCHDETATYLYNDYAVRNTKTYEKIRTIDHLPAYAKVTIVDSTRITISMFCIYDSRYFVKCTGFTKPE